MLDKEGLRSRREPAGMAWLAHDRAVMELAGIRDVLTKALGSTTSVNLVKATVEGLKQLRSKAAIEQARGVKITL